MKDMATFMQIDLQNLFYAARNVGHKMDFEKIWDYFSQRETEFLTESLMYMIRSPDFDSERFETKLKAVGYSLRVKNALKTSRNNDTCVWISPNVDFRKNGIRSDQVSTIDPLSKPNRFVYPRDWVRFFKNSRPLYTQTNQDVAITVECIDRMNSFDKWILMSGDGDFVDLCKYLKHREKKIEIWSFKECFNPALEPYADKMYFIEDKFFYKKPGINVFGFNWGKLQ